MGNMPIPPAQDRIPGDLSKAMPVPLLEQPALRSPEVPLPRVAIINETSAMARVLPALRSAMEHLDQLTVKDLEGAGIIEYLSNNITALQEDFLQALYEGLEQAGVETSSKLTLHLSEESRLTVYGEHPDAKRIQKILEERTDFSTLFTEIAVQSAALRDLRSLRTLTLYATSEDGYSVLLQQRGESRYQISLKGEMNHFYFARQSG